MAPTATVTAQIRLLGIRHHGPGSARAVEAALRADPPDAVLIECPADADGIVALAGHPDMQPPVAMLAYVVDRPERAAFFPYASFCPEWVAIRWALANDVPVRCIDLPARTMLAERPPAPEPDEALHTAPPRPLDPIGALAEAHELDRNTQLTLHRHDNSALGGAVKFRQGNTGDIDNLGEDLGLCEPVLARGRVENQDHLIHR